MNGTKVWYKSKTILANLAVVLGIVVQVLTNVELPVGPEIQVAILGIVNIVLRLLTKDPVAVK